MTYGLTALTIDANMLADACGHGGSLLPEILEEERSRIDALDRAFHGRPGPSVTDALGELLSGTPPSAPQGAHIYGYAFEMICSRLGRPLPNTALAPASLPFLERVDAALEELELGGEFCTQSLVFGSAPVALPRIEDFPSIGFVDGPTVSLFDNLWKAVRPDLEPLDPHVRSAIEQLHDWVGRALANHHGIIAFYY